MDSPTTANSGSAAWHPDPSGRYEFRYFNGERWTADVSIDGVRYVDQTSMSPGQGASVSAAPTGPAAISVAPLPPGTTPQAPGNGKAVLAFLLGLASVLLGWTPFLFVIAAGAAVAAIVLGAQVLRRRPTVRKTRGFAVAAVSLAPVGLALCIVGVILTGATLREFDEYTDPGPRSVEITECSLEAGMATTNGIVENLSNEVRTYVVVIELRDGIERVETLDVAVDDVDPGATDTWSSRQFVGDVDLDCRVRSVRGPYPFGLDPGTD